MKVRSTIPETQYFARTQPRDMAQIPWDRPPRFMHLARVAISAFWLIVAVWGAYSIYVASLQ